MMRRLVTLAAAWTLASQVAATWYFVAEDGSDGASGKSVRAPLATLQKALELAGPGDTIVLRPGVYHQDAVSVRNGEPDAPIRIVGSSDSIVHGAGSAYVLEIEHDHIELSGFTVDGHHAAGDEASDYRDKLVYIHATDGAAGITGVRVTGMRLLNARGECVRLKNRAHGNEISGNTIRDCGLGHYRFKGRVKNGEGIYIGGSSRRIDVRRTDASTGNRITHNRIERVGECIDVKEGADRNRIEHNVCLDALDPESGGISVRSNGNLIDGNVIGGSRGAGVRLGGYGNADGIDNRVTGNQLQYNEAGALKIMRVPQAIVCGNEVHQPAGWPEVRFGDAGSTPVTKRCPERQESGS